jgi:DNA transposition AAA+ family ATPase
MEAPFPVLDSPVDSSLYFLDLPGTRTLATADLDAVREGLTRAVTEQAMMCLSGDAGTGKTLAAHAALQHYPDHAVLPLPSRPGPTDLRRHLHHTLALAGDAPADPGVADTLIRSALAGQRRVVLVDEADRLSASGFEYLRHLHDDLGGLCVVLIAGHRGERALRNQRMLHSRTAVWHTVTALPRHRAPAAAYALHPVWQHVAATDLRALDACYAQGNLRRWACLTHHAHRLLVRSGTDRFTCDLIEALIDRIDPPCRH